ncbi:phosphoserine phosphatase [Mycetocola sp. BIGb0189]|uniref:phosphoserine phosphatase SerB n=1 Tax=Mycetocola sp. BIGb0189 TaxID=2940604 RepID=UPI0021676593|nr:phosphoserine phosphatase SerB [Mycetocola sp. BIGb0189]MCS4277032.1 phosphoserine phosphatase [Mycetocola sp. BIGb0189]
MSDSPARFLVILDVDSTLIKNEAIELIAERAGSLEHVAAVTERAMRGELDFAASLRERVATLKDLSVSEIDAVRAKIELSDGARDLIAGVHGAGGRVAVVSGGFHELLDPLAESLGLDRWRANRLEVIDGALTGKVLGDIIDAEAKAVALREWAGEFGVPLERTIAVGDGANDLKMMAIAGLSVAYDAKPAVRAQASVAVGSRNLSDILPLLGLRG